MPKLRWEDASGIYGRDGLCYEAVAAARYIREGLTESPWHSLVETVAVMQTIDDACRQVAAQAGGVRSAATRSFAVWRGFVVFSGIFGVSYRENLGG